MMQYISLDYICWCVLFKSKQQQSYMRFLTISGVKINMMILKKKACILECLKVLIYFLSC